MFTAIRSAFTENTRSSVGLNDLVSSGDGDDNNSGKDFPNDARKYVKLSEVVEDATDKIIPEYSHQPKAQTSSSQSPVSKKPPTYVQLVSAIVGYSLCNSQLLIINKITLAYVPAPCFLLFCQLLASGVAVRVLAELRVLVADKLDVEKAKGFLVVVFTFVTTLFANMKIGRAHVRTPVTSLSRMPSSA